LGEKRNEGKKDEKEGRKEILLLKIKVEEEEKELEDEDFFS
jgi:hypothetical protein